MKKLKNSGTLPLQQSLWEVFPVNPTQQPVNDSEQRMTATSGHTVLKQFGSFARNGAFSKMFVASLIGMEGWYSTRCRLTWKLKATKLHRFYFQLAVSTLPTEGTEFGLLPTPLIKNNENRQSEGYGPNLGMALGLLPTPTTQEPESECDLTESGRRKTKAGKGSRGLNLGRLVGLLKTPTAMDGDVTSGKKNPVSGDSGTLAQEIMSQYPPTMLKLGLLPTPDCSDRRSAMSKQQGLSNVIKGMLPTPTADDNPAKNTGKRNQDGLQKRAFQETGKTSQLTPLFVAEMMGFPPNWLELPFLNTETNPSKPTEMP